ncbi:hypothetical protein Q1695_014580 [Nippostrongylus brasiliensis]|nr:hypothetical protein Q1695_014580 [Nippostrongylus brasiliensis]
MFYPRGLWLAVIFYRIVDGAGNTCEGGLVTEEYIRNTIEGKNCREISGGLYFLKSNWQRNRDILNVFKNITTVQGPLHFSQTTGMGHIDFFSNLDTISTSGPLVVILNNHGLKSLNLSSLMVMKYEKTTKVIMLHNNDEFDQEKFLEDMKKKGISEDEMLHTSQTGMFNNIWTAIIFQIIFVIMVFFVVIFVYFVYKEAKMYRALCNMEKVYKQYKPPQVQR